MKQIIKSATKHCLEILFKSRCSSLPFHNATHTLEVYENVIKIGTYDNIDFEQLEPTLLAALFHDTGNANVYKGHENFSIANANTFLLTQEYPADKSALTIDCIKATQMPQKPKNKFEEINCDADLFHLGRSSYSEKNKLLRSEWAMFLNKEYSDVQWLKLNIEFMEQHYFHSRYGKELLAPGKHRNLLKLKSKLKKLVHV